MTQDELNEVLRKHMAWLNDEKDGVRADLHGADLREAYLRGAYLHGAYLHGANIDFSCWPLWCGSKDVKVDARIAAQLAAHFCVLDCDDPGYQAARTAILDFAKTSHRAEDLGIK